MAQSQKKLTNLPIGYEIEICDKKGVTLDLLTAMIEEIEKVVWKMPINP